MTNSGLDVHSNHEGLTYHFGDVAGTVTEEALRGSGVEEIVQRGDHL